jgi:hypothetical protein
MLAAKAWAAAGKFQAQAEHHDGSANLQPVGISRWAWRQPEGAEGSLSETEDTHRTHRATLGMPL